MLVASETKNPAATSTPPAAGHSRPCQNSSVLEHFVALIPTAWGMCGVAWKYHDNEYDFHASPFASRPINALLCRIIPPGLTPADLRRDLMRNLGPCNEVLGDGRGNFHPEVVPDWFPELVLFLQGYYTTGLRDWTQPRFAGSSSFWNARLDWSSLTPFQRDVLQNVSAIDYGCTLTYGQVAKQIGKPAATRAVGAALGANPWPVLIPCHRVVGAGGRMTGFSAPGGITAKKKMLELEQSGHHASRSSAP